MTNSGEVVNNKFGYSDNQLTIMLEDFCTIGLGMPLEKLHHWERPFDYDAYRIVTHDNLQFVISGPHIAQWLKSRER